MNLTLEGILESDLNICITYDHNRFGPFMIGRMTIKQAGIYSLCCAVQNVWLTARVENIGVGWVSIIDNKDLKNSQASFKYKTYCLSVFRICKRI